MEFFILCDITCLQWYLFPLGQKIATQENCKQDRNSLAKSVQKEKKCSKNLFVKVRYFVINSMMQDFVSEKMTKTSYK